MGFNNDQWKAYQIEMLDITMRGFQVHVLVSLKLLETVHIFSHLPIRMVVIAVHSLIKL